MAIPVREKNSRAFFTVVLGTNDLDTEVVVLDITRDPITEVLDTVSGSSGNIL